MDLPLTFANSGVYTVEFRVIPALNYARILGMAFLHRFNPGINFKNHTITWKHL